MEDNSLKKNEVIRLFSKIEKIYTFRNIINFFIKSKTNNIYKNIIYVNMFIVMLINFFVIPIILINIMQSATLVITILHIIVMFVYYKIFKMYIINSYFKSEIYKENLKNFFNKKEVLIIEELIQFKMTPLIKYEEQVDFLKKFKK